MKPLGEHFTVRVPFQGHEPFEHEMAQAARDEGARIRGHGYNRTVQPSLSPDWKIASMTFNVYGVGDAPVQTYIVDVRLSGHMTIEVDASSEEEAGDMAYDMAMDEADAADLDADVDHVRLKPPQQKPKIDVGGLGAA